MTPTRSKLCPQEALTEWFQRPAPTQPGTVWSPRAHHNHPTACSICNLLLWSLLLETLIACFCVMYLYQISSHSFCAVFRYLAEAFLWDIAGLTAGILAHPREHHPLPCGHELHWAASRHAPSLHPSFLPSRRNCLYPSLRDSVLTALGLRCCKVSLSCHRTLSSLRKYIWIKTPCTLLVWHFLGIWKILKYTYIWHNISLENPTQASD